MTVLACSALTKIDNHSEDQATVWHGAESPALLCWFHAAYLRPEDWETMRQAGTIV